MSLVGIPILVEATRQYPDSLENDLIALASSLISELIALYLVKVLPRAAQLAEESRPASEIQLLSFSTAALMFGDEGAPIRARKGTALLPEGLPRANQFRVATETQRI